MAKLSINRGVSPNDGTGDSLYAGAGKVNANFDEIYSAIGNGTTLGQVNFTTLNVSGISTLVGLVTATNDLYVGNNFYVNGISTFIGNVTFRAGTIGLGDSITDNIIFTGEVNSDIIPNIDATYDLGNDTQRWRQAAFSGIVTADTFVGQVNSGVGTISTLDSTLGTIVTLNGTDLTYNTADIDTAYITSGIVTTLSGTNLTYTTADIDTAYITSGIVTTIQGTDASYTNAYVNTGIVTTLAGTNLTYTTADIDTAYITSGIVTSLTSTNATLTNIDSVGITTLGIVTATQVYVSGVSTFGNTVVGGATTQLIVTGNTRITGILTIGTSSITLDGDNNTITLGSGVTITSSGAGSFNNGLNVSGVSTFSSAIDANGDLDVDGRTELDVTNISETLNVVGISTFSSDIDINASIDVSGTTTTGQLNVTGVSTFQGNVNLGDNDKIRLGNLPDMEIFHDGANSIIDDVGQGGLVLRSDTFTALKKRTGDENQLVANPDGAVELYYDNSKKFETTPSGVTVTGGANLTGVVTATQFHTGASGSAIRIDSSTITGPSEITIDPSAVGDNTGAVRIKGDLLVDGTQTIINSTTIELADFIVGIASTATTDVLADGAGIKIGPNNTLLYDHANTSLKSSENFNISSGKTFKINGSDVLSSTTLGSSVVASSLTTLGTLSVLNVGGNLNVTGVSTFVGVTTFQSAATFQSTINASGNINSSTDVTIDGISVLATANDDATALAIALG